MSKTLIIGGIALFFILSMLVDFVNELHDDVDDSSSKKKHHLQENSPYSQFNAIGEEMLVLTTLPESKKKGIWNDSTLKKEMLELSPNFIYMKELIESRVIDEGEFKQKLLNHIDETEMKFLSGSLNGERLKITLSTF